MPSLSAHPIFQIEREAYESIKQTTRRNVVAFKGTEAYVAVGSTVRYAELREWFALDSQLEDDKPQYRVEISLPRLTLDTKIPKCYIRDSRTCMESEWYTISSCRNT